MNEKKQYIDHLGNIYSSFNDMCQKFGIARSTVSRRLDNGWSLEKALTTPCLTKKCHIDHKGIDYGNKKNMLEHYKIPSFEFDNRLKKGLTLEQALTTPYLSRKDKNKSHISESFTNHQGLKMTIIKYNSFVDVSVRFDDGTIREHLRYAEIKKGEVLHPNCDIAQTEKIRKQIEGSRFLTKNGLYIECLEYISNRKMVCVYENGIKVVTNKYNWDHDLIPFPCKFRDFNGKTYKSVKMLCQEYNISYNSYHKRITSGWTLEETLLIPLGWREIYDPYAKLFELDGESFYRYKCPFCTNEYIFSKSEVREHYVFHIKNLEGND